MNYEEVNMITCGFGNCYVVRGKRGDILIDTCTKEYRNEIETWLHNYDIKMIVLTHGHNDHIGNAAYFSKLYGADIAMCVYDMKLAHDNGLHKLYSIGAAGKILAAASMAPKTLRKSRAESFGIDIFLDDGMALGEDFGADCTAVKLDGHTKGSFGVLCDGDLYVGDAAMNFIKPSFPLICESPKAARASLNRIRELKPKRIFFGHGKPIEAGTEEYRKMFIG
ncbi:MAG: MBL fold metallo-hydrolase [Oscillospiraceae bacterium]|nr:MBL fold metallo-hydrolase [Oscillospiraceae bacterium]